MQDKKERVLRNSCKDLEEEKTKESSKKNRDDELEKICLAIKNFQESKMSMKDNKP